MRRSREVKLEEKHFTVALPRKAVGSLGCHKPSKPSRAPCCAYANSFNCDLRQEGQTFGKLGLA